MMYYTHRHIIRDRYRGPRVLARTAARAIFTPLEACCLIVIALAGLLALLHACGAV